MIVGMIGENGAGKTTTLMSVFEMISPDSGQIRLFGKSWRENRKETLQKVGLVMDGLNQNPRLYCKDLENIYKRSLQKLGQPIILSVSGTFFSSIKQKDQKLFKGHAGKAEFRPGSVLSPGAFDLR